LSLLRELVKARSGLEYLEVVLRYLAVAAPHLSDEELKHAVEEAFPQIGGALMATIAEKWVEQGIERGVKRGILYEAREALLDILETRFATLPPAIAAAIAGVDDPSQLKKLRKQSLTVTSPAEFERVLETYAAAGVSAA
jgi:hypothetical protein